MCYSFVPAFNPRRSVFRVRSRAPFRSPVESPHQRCVFCAAEMASAPIVVCLLLVALLGGVAASGVFELSLDSFSNELGRDIKGHCCSGYRSAVTGQCSESCRTQFRVCLKHYQTTIDLQGPCTYGNFVTPVLGADSVVFDAGNASANNGYTVRLPFEFSWPVSCCCISFMTVARRRRLST